MKIRDNYTCPLELTHDIIRGKWKPIILWQLGKGAASLSTLQNDITEIGQKMLLQHLGELQHFGMVQKQLFEGYPLKVEYSLTDKGMRMLNVIVSMQEIGIELMLEDGKEEFLKSKGLI
ncbi:helix-turn-helix transcriptional regulator [Bariatricus massiliensis]|uniref:Helix-turn-helix transcriptional regulator n=1 Tax=Bariatricus massiliensis TaxID=1745713 RepID=A0ABS8DCI6_9FIRM|nr:helix-turn-helix domain-containing protein [Bariatricus massiliensis]MCB7303324.1 helix-turn-helix transcriptional regulator [Bariatricus massiliensis]MCB7373456.1 helix-turn-helix transcriptional regulator [Bariatricus massiliensis]MCB7386126.1 helix-turn-helix transcriptional regulator [Bariatricus massiliensis]MCB7410288.1 helix-turn-helix transcriptional regulator [Bariatricus massiliensis]MCQ5252428.1 helix-turn-helix transcriptional regulator [Bariatricus massiliensis]